MSTEVEPDAKEAYPRALVKMLQTFHDYDLSRAVETVRSFMANVQDIGSIQMLLHQDPYMTAAELAREPIHVTNQRIAGDWAKARRIWTYTTYRTKVRLKSDGG